MCSYNQINNSYGCQNSKLLNGILKGELGFQGFVMSDWAAQHSGVSSAVAGLDVSKDVCCPYCNLFANHLQMSMPGKDARSSINYPEDLHFRASYASRRLGTFFA